MTTNATATFTVTATDPDLPIQMSASATMHERLAALPTNLTAERHGDVGRYIFSFEKDIVAATAALADASGFIVVENTDGWTAIEPNRDAWNKTPGAHRRWAAGIKRSDPRYDGRDILWIQYKSANDPRQIEAYQGCDGWQVACHRDANTKTVRFTHAPT